MGAVAIAARQAPAGGEALTALVRDCATAGAVRRALLLRLSRLPPQLAKPHHLRLIRAAIEPLALGDRARSFQPHPAALAVIWRGDAEAQVAKVRSVLDHLLADAPVIDKPDLVALFDLPDGGDALLQAVAEEARPAEQFTPAEALVAPLDVTALAALEAALAQANVASFARRKRICRRSGDKMRLAWERRFLSIDELTLCLAPDRAPKADPWLFRRLTRTLDRRMLALLAAPGELAGAGPFALDLNIATILSPEFLRFDAALPIALRDQVVLNLLPADILADLAAFLFARDFARTRGYRLLLRAVSHAQLPMLPLPRLDLDYLQVHWTPDLSQHAAALRLAAPDPSRVVLARVDEPAALDWGAQLGIGLFQGRAIVA